MIPYINLRVYGFYGFAGEYRANLCVCHHCVFNHFSEWAQSFKFKVACRRNLKLETLKLETPLKLRGEMELYIFKFALGHVQNEL